MRRALIFVAVMLVTLFGLAELAVRARGNVDVPLFQQDDAAGYIVSPSQSGRDSRSAWAFNELSLATSKPYREDPNAVLVVGDSVVFAARDEIKAALGGRTVWVASTGGWQLQNQLGYLNAHPELKSVKRIVFVTNSGDFGPASAWDPGVRLDHHPICGVCFVASRKMLGEKVYVDPPPSPQSLAAIRLAATRFGTGYAGQVYALSYPTKKETVEQHHSAVPSLLRGAFPGRDLHVVDLTSSWSEAYYGDPIHPNAAGRAALGKAVAKLVAG